MNRYILKPINIPLVGVTILIRNLKIRRHSLSITMVSYISDHAQLLNQVSIFHYSLQKQLIRISIMFFGKPLFNGTDCEWMKVNSNSVMRKQIKSIENSRILTKQNITSKIFRSQAKKAGIPEDVYSIGSLVFPKIQKTSKILLSFQNDDIFEGHFAKSIFISNSKRIP